MLTLPSGILDKLDEGRIALRWLVRFDLDGGSEGLWNDTYSVEVDSVTYAPTAGNMQFDPLEASSDLDADQLRITVAGLLPSVTGILSGVAWHQRPVTVYRGFLTDAGAVEHTVAVFSGFLDSLVIQDADDGFSTIDAIVESNNRELNRTTGRSRSDADQRGVSASDGFFKYAASANTDVQINWGRKGPQYPVRPK